MVVIELYIQRYKATNHNINSRRVSSDIGDLHSNNDLPL